MRKIMFIALALMLATGAEAQKLRTEDKRLDRCFGIAVRTLYRNIDDNVIMAGGSYGGEWTRDVAINTWNAANMLIHEAAANSLWNVTTDGRQYIGHQYWDQIIWVIGAYDHFMATGDREFLAAAYVVSSNSMHRLEKEVFDSGYGLFTGPSVFNDGISAYDEPVYDPAVGSSYVLDYPKSRKIMCLSTNCIYYEAYRLLYKMAMEIGKTEEAAGYAQKAALLKDAIRNHLFDEDTMEFHYFIDGNGSIHHYQEALGIAFAIMFGIVGPEEAEKVVDNTYVGPYGIPSLYPSFSRFSRERPGRHNVLIWPFVNAFWAEAALISGREDMFIHELEHLTSMVLKSRSCFYEIYDMYSGKVCGGWQAGNRREWDSIHRQTWSATGYIRMVLRGILGLYFNDEGLVFRPDASLVRYFGFTELSGLPVGDGLLYIRCRGCGDEVRDIIVDGKPSGQDYVKMKVPFKGSTVLEIVM